MKKEKGKHFCIARDRSALYGMLSFVYIQIPERKTLELNFADQASKLFEAIPKEAKETSEAIAEGIRTVRDYIHKRDMHLEECALELSKDWTRLFRGVDRSGPPPPYESVYRTERMQAKCAQDIHRLFSKMGIRVPEEWHQPPDYIGVELDFMRLLCEKELRHRNDSQLKALREVLDEERAFLEDHLGLWVPNFCKRMLEEAREDYYRGIAHLTLGLVAFDRLWVPRLLSLF
jgi:putative dimethyl sulfoxide reductase chaperone